MQAYTKDNTLATAGYCHDIGKPLTADKYFDHGKECHHFPYHAEFGADLVLDMEPSLFEKFGLDQGYIANIVYVHSIPIRQIKGIGLSQLVPENYAILRENILNGLDKANIPVEGKTVPPEEVATLFLADTLGKGNFKNNKSLIDFATYLYKSLVDDSRDMLKISKVPPIR